MLGIQSVTTLAQVLGVSRSELEAVAREHSDCVSQLEILDPRKIGDPSKRAIRNIISIKRRYRLIQLRLQKSLFSRRMSPSEWNHGCIRGRGPITNASVHSGQRFALKMDVHNFFPSLSAHRLCSFLIRRQNCSPKVAGILTQLCTYEFHLSLGLITSPLLADHLFTQADRRIAGLCHAHGLKYSRFVDDLTVSGAYDPREQRIDQFIDEILNSEGLQANDGKSTVERADKEIVITGVRIRGNRIDVPTHYLNDLIASCATHAALGRNEEFTGPLYTSSQLLGKILHACHLNPKRRGQLMSHYHKIDWNGVWHHAERGGLVYCKTIIAKRGQARAEYEAVVAERQRNAGRWPGFDCVTDDSPI